MFLTSGYQFTGNLPLLSFQQKISNATNTTGSSKVFALTTYSGNMGLYVPGVSDGLSTTIQTLGSNHVLNLFANGSASPDLNRVNIGTRKSTPFFTLFPGPFASPGYGSITVGPTSDSSPGQLGIISGAVFTSKGMNAVAPKNYANHSLYVRGIQTIGDSDPLSGFSSSSTDSNKAVSNYSMLKIGRVLATSTISNSGGYSASGPYPGSYPNGLEITSVIATGKGSIIPKGTNLSVAIAVGAISNYEAAKGGKNPINTTGFFVSDTGQSVSIGAPINSLLALQVVGDAGITGSVDVVGSFSVTGDVSVADPNFTTLATFVPLTAWTAGSVGYLNPIGFGSGPEVAFNPNLSCAWTIKDYDRIIYISTSNSGSTSDSRIAIFTGNYLSDSSLSNPILVWRDKYFDGFSTRSFLLPANQTFQVTLDFEAGTSYTYNFTVKERKIGK
jgi:hypothetical protein